MPSQGLNIEGVAMLPYPAQPTPTIWIPRNLFRKVEKLFASTQQRAFESRGVPDAQTNEGLIIAPSADAIRSEMRP